MKQSILRHSIDVLVLMAPKRKRLDENGLQFCNGQQKMKPEDCFRELTRISRAWDSYVTAVIVEYDGERCCVLKCKGTGCSAELSCTNPSAQVAAHRAICKGSQPRRSPRQHGTNASRVSDEAEGSAEPTRRQLSRALQVESWKSNLEKFTIKPTQQKQFNKLFALYIITSETPFQRANNPFLRNALSILGAAMPDEKVSRTRLLNELYEETKALVDEDMRKLLNVSG